MLFGSPFDHFHWTCSSARLAEAASRPAIQAMAAGGTGLPLRQPGNQFFATAAAASARAGEGFMSATNPAAPIKSLCASPFTTPPTVWARLLPVRFDSHQANA